MIKTIFLPVSTVNVIFNDPSRSAAAAKLVYVNDTREGITRIQKGRTFSYLYKGKKVIDQKDLERIRKLVIPPSWTSVWICKQHNGHIQATGMDAMKRKQYKYHADWNAMRNHTKFQRLAVFGKKLPQLRSQLEKDLNQKELTLEKVLALMISLMEHTYIRIGNNGYEKLYGSYGLSTLKDQHVKVQGSDIRFSFKGKKGVNHTITLNNKKLARIVKQCREIPGKELFQYYDGNNALHTVHSEHVNAYIKNITGEEFTSKDFRTWAGSVHAIHSLLELGEAEKASVCKDNLVKTLDYVSTKLGNTRAVCKKYYIHPDIMDLYESNQLLKYTTPDSKRQTINRLREEKILLQILNRKRS